MDVRDEPNYRKKIAFDFREYLTCLSSLIFIDLECLDSCPARMQVYQEIMECWIRLLRYSGSNKILKHLGKNIE